MEVAVGVSREVDLYVPHAGGVYDRIDGFYKVLCPCFAIPHGQVGTAERRAVANPVYWQIYIAKQNGF